MHRYLLYAMLCLTGLASAELIFENEGTKKGWDSVNAEHDGKVEESTKNSQTSLAMTQVYDSSYHGRYHSEAGKSAVYKVGDTGAYAFTFRLQDDWSFDEQSYNLAQFIADFSSTGCDDSMPSTMVWIVGNQLYSRVKQGSICSQKTQTFPKLATVSAGAWHTVIIEASWQNDNTGFFRLYFDGQKVLDKNKIVTTIKETKAFDYRIGLYANGWHDDKSMKGNQGTRTVYYDYAAVGSKLEDVNRAGGKSRIVRRW